MRRELAGLNLVLAVEDPDVNVCVVGEVDVTWELGDAFPLERADQIGQVTSLALSLRLRRLREAAASP